MQMLRQRLNWLVVCANSTTTLFRRTTGWGESVSLDDFEFSPMKALLDDGPHNRCLRQLLNLYSSRNNRLHRAAVSAAATTSSATAAISAAEQPVAPQPQYQQPQQQVAPQHNISSRNNRLRHSRNISSRKTSCAAAAVSTAATTGCTAAEDTLLHPLLMRNGDSRPLHKRRRRCLLWIC